jgi:hypothetical protein
MSVANEPSGQQSSLAQFGSGFQGDTGEDEAACDDLRHGLSWVLAEIDPDTLPDTDPWPEVGRRLTAWRADRPGWRTGEVEATLGEFGGADE